MSLSTPIADFDSADEGGSPGRDEARPRKIFVGGLSWSTTPERLKDHFEQFGDVIECMIMKDVFTKRSRGFGFITFNDADSVGRALEYGEHQLDGKTIDPKVAFPRERQAKMVTRTKKVFVGGLSASTTQEHLRAYFARFGPIEDVTLMYDRATQRHRGFGFVTFEDERTCDIVVDLHFHDINERKVECKKAQPKEVMWAQNYANSKQALFRNGAAQLTDILAAAMPLAAAAGPAAAAAAFHPLALMQQSRQLAPYALPEHLLLSPFGAPTQPNAFLDRQTAYDLLNAGMAAAYAPGINGFHQQQQAGFNLFAPFVDDPFAAAFAAAATNTRYSDGMNNNNNDARTQLANDDNNNNTAAAEPYRTDGITN